MVVYMPFKFDIVINRVVVISKDHLVLQKQNLCGSILGHVLPGFEQEGTQGEVFL